MPNAGSKHREAVRKTVEEACVLYHSDLKAFLLGVLKNSSSAEDALQRTVVRALESCASVRLETLRGWLFQIAFNEARQIQRTARRDAKVREKFAEYVSETAAAYSTGRADWWTESGVLLDGLVPAIQASIGKLTEEQQIVIRKRIYEGLTFAEIAEQMNKPLGSVLTWMRRGLSRLREDSGLRDHWTE